MLSCSDVAEKIVIFLVLSSQFLGTPGFIQKGRFASHLWCRNGLWLPLVVQSLEAAFDADHILGSELMGRNSNEPWEKLAHSTREWPRCIPPVSTLHRGGRKVDKRPTFWGSPPPLHDLQISLWNKTSASFLQVIENIADTVLIRFKKIDHRHYILFFTFYISFFFLATIILRQTRIKWQIILKMHLRCDKIHWRH